MNWYKLITAQEEFGNTEYSDSVEDDLWDASSWEEIDRILTHHRMNHEMVELGDGSEIMIAESSEKVPNRYGYGSSVRVYVIDDTDMPDLKEAHEWIDTMPEHQVDAYLNWEDTDPWDGIPAGYVVYHGTYADRVDDILKHGLEARSESRGINNRGMGAAVFTSADPETPLLHYDKVIAIHMGKMKEDGYTPAISGETPLEESQKRASLAHMIGLKDYIAEEYSSEGYAEDTIAIYGDIPPKYLELLD